MTNKSFKSRMMGTWSKAAVLTSGVLLSFSMTGLQTVNADWTEPNGGAAVNNEQLVTSSVPTQLWCTWYVNGVDDISLQPQIVGTVDGLPVFAEYEGADMDLDTNQDQEILLAGWTATGKPTLENRLSVNDEFDCDWYAGGVGVNVTVTSDITTSGFSANASTGGTDLEMGWQLSESPLVVVYVGRDDIGGNNCLNWTLESLTQTQTFNGTDLGGSIVSKIADESTSSYCAITANYFVTMPGDMQPQYAGQNYTFTGPTLTTKVAFITD